MDKFEENNSIWQLQQWGQQLGEWWELQTQKLAGDPSRNGLPDWLKNLGLPDWAYQLILWIALGVILTWLSWQLLRVGIPYLKKMLPRYTQAHTSRPQARPLKMQKWLERSRQFQAQGNYTEACRCLYFALLQHLDEKEIISQQESRTDREYRQLITPFPDHSLYQILLTTHEELCFGLQSMSPETLAQCHEALETILASSSAKIDPVKNPINTSLSPND